MNIWHPGEMYLDQCDEAFDPPKPLLVSLEELGEWSAKVVSYLKKRGINGGNYQGEGIINSIENL